MNAKQHESPGARVCHPQQVAPTGLEDPGQIAGTVEHAGHFNAVVRGEVKDEVVAHPLAAEVHRKFRSEAALLWNGGQALALDAELVDELIGGVRVVAGNVEPNLGEIGLGQFGDASVFHRPLARLARRSAARSFRPCALIREAAAASNGTTLPARIWSAPARSC